MCNKFISSLNSSVANRANFITSDEIPLLVMELFHKFSNMDRIHEVQERITYITVILSREEIISLIINYNKTKKRPIFQ